MKRNSSNLLEWQWKNYSGAHQNKTNLIVHLCAVPLFISATFGLSIAIARLSLAIGAASLGAIALSLALQGKGHALEQRRASRFTGVRDFVSRMLAEQFVTFPRFLLTGGWGKNFSRR
ncbi:Mpo1-like protein [Pseudanabaena sp. PCC 6802]|uniref:Mpo1-like protein n=1 Tax=Pseudanabaena sp. PCC 6802 TaxID=118173 RepID=UPI000369BFC6|nr:Mpo1-like protein [Pseudanabaena sp. PCC 6802]